MTIDHCEQSLLIDTPEGQKSMAYQVWRGSHAQSRRVVVCVHGLTRNSRDFDFIAPQLADEALVVCPDVFGRGNSDRMRQAEHYGYPLYVQQMMQLLAHIQEEYAPDHVDWLGTSMGGLIGMMLAATPAKQMAMPLRRLVLNDVGYWIPYPSLQRIGAYVGQQQWFASVADVESYLRDIAKPFGPLTDEQWRHLARYSCEPEPQEKEQESARLTLRYDTAIADAFNAVHTDIDLSAIWQQVQQPVLLIRGADSDLLLPETARQMAQQPNVTLVEFAGIGHAPMLMANDQIAAVKPFFADNSD